MRFIEVIAALGAIGVSFAHAQSEPSTAQGEQPNRIAIEYVRPQIQIFRASMKR